MKGVRLTGSRHAELAELPIPSLRKGEVLIKVKVSAVCGSERIDYENGCGYVPGHEFAGEVAETNGCGQIRRGDRVAVNVLCGCGTCYYCKAGLPQFCRSCIICQGGHAQYAVVPEKCCLKLPERMDYETGVLIGGDTLGVAFRAVSKLPKDLGKIIMVSGTGPIGLGMILTLKYFGYYVVAAEPILFRNHFAVSAAGADEVFSSPEAAAERICELTGGMGADAVMECSGNGRAQKHALKIVKPQGTVVFCGENYSQIEIAPSQDIIHKEVCITGAFYFTENDFHNMCMLYERGFDPIKLVSHRFPLHDAQKAYQCFFEGNTGKVLLTDRA